MNFNKNLHGLICKLIYDQTIYLRHWMGKVTDAVDPLNRGRVKATIPELGFMADSDAVWCSPRQGYSLAPPARDEWVEIYFMGGDAKKPVYLIGFGEIEGNKPEAYKENLETRVVWYDSVNGDRILYNQSKKIWDLLVGELAIKVDVDAKAMDFTCGTETIKLDNDGDLINVAAGDVSMELNNTDGKVVVDANGVTMEMDGTGKKITIDAGGTDIILDGNAPGKVTINGSLEVS